MLGCIHPMSSPMMKRMLGFCPCWAKAGMLAIVVVLHAKTRAPQIVLSMRMIAFLKCRLPNLGPQSSPTSTHRPSLPLPIHAGSCFGQSVGRLARGRLGEVSWKRYALPARCSLSLPIAPQRDGRRFTKDGAIRHGKAPKLEELMISGDLRDSCQRRIGTS